MKITIIKPDDMHLHLRDGKRLKDIVNLSARQMGRAIIMPNLNPPITTTDQALEYKKHIKKMVGNYNFEPLMTLYLTDNTKPEEVLIASNNSIVGFKLYPRGATTNSDNGVSDVDNIYSVLEKMQELKMPLLIHGEVVDKGVDIFDAEAVFIDKTLNKITKDFPDLKIVFEHITTKDAVDFVLSNKNNVAATITAHHLVANRSDMLAGGIKPHYYCLPILKRKEHQQALIKAATSGSSKFFLGTDSAPHSVLQKESACGCAGIFSAHCAIELYASVFDKQNALNKLEGFSSKFGADFYNLAHNKGTITLIKQNWNVPDSYKFADSTVKPFMAGKTLDWKLVHESR